MAYKVTKQYDFGTNRACGQYTVPTPKRGVGGSNPLWDARKHRRKPLFSRAFGFSYIKSCEKALSLYEIKFYSRI